MDKKEPIRNFKMLVVVSLAVLAVVIASAVILIEKQDVNGQQDASEDPVSFDYEDLKYQGYLSTGAVNVIGLADGKSPMSLTIPATIVHEGREYKVTSIGDYAFRYHRFTGSLTIPSSITSVGIRAFERSGFTGSLTIPSSVVYIADSAFRECGFTGSLTIPSSVITISHAAFYSCEFDGRLTLEDGVKHIGCLAFCDCRFTGSLTIPSSVISVDNYAFQDCSLSIVKILSGRLGSDIFGSNNISEIHVAKGVIVEWGSLRWHFTDHGEEMSRYDVPGKWFRYIDGCMVKQGDFSPDADNGNALNAYVKEGDGLNAPADPTKEGSHFAYWSLDESKVTFPFIPNASLTLKTHWEVSCLTVTDPRTY